ncbi:MAG: zinc-dependent metalloprotease [Elusimicrobia bacterium]|nr:zinc-dependent metalloprotease [Elusimicrobiota bacterium]
MKTLLALAASLSLSLPAAAQVRAPALTDAGPGAGVARAEALAAKDAADRPLFFVLQWKEGWMLSLQAGQLDKPYLLTMTLAKGLGEHGLYSGMPLGNALVVFRRRDGALMLDQENTQFRAAPGSPEAKGVADSYPDVPLAAVKIATENAATGDMLVSADALFRGDLAGLSEALAGAYGLPPQALHLVSSRLVSVSAHHDNVEVENEYIFAPAAPVDSQTLPDTRLLPLTVHYSLSVMPKSSGFDERPADPRVGYFTTDYRDYSAARLKGRFDPIVRLANHWRLEKAVPDAPVSDVKNPIVWWLDPATPKEYRAAVKAGILAWNAAFESIGLRHAIVVKEVDKDLTPEQRKHFDLNDASHNVVRWFFAPGAGFAEGLSRVNPLTGEIYSATVMLSDQMSRVWDGILQPELLSKIPADVRPNPALLSALEARGLTPAQKAGIVQKYLTSVVVHEIGHTLGLRHNFKGSLLHSLADEGKDGNISSSVMDYLPMNVPGKGQPPIYFQTHPGPYDDFAIKYAYEPLPSDPAKRAAALKAIADEANGNKTLAYGTDEDVQGIDPDVQRFDFSNQPILYADESVARAETLWARAADAATPAVLPPPRQALLSGLQLYAGSVASVLPEIGGVRSDRRPVDEGGPRMTPVPASEQMAALDFLSRRVFAADAFAVPPQLVLRAAPDPLEASAGNALPDVPGYALGVQQMALRHIYAAATLRRLTTAEQIEPKTAMTVGALFETVRRSIWSELGTTGTVSITPLRRQLQRADVAALVSVTTAPGEPEDAVALALSELQDLASSARAAESRAADPEVKAHLAEIARLAGKAADGGSLARN